jgi:uncharacterized membrane protein
MQIITQLATITVVMLVLDAVWLTATSASSRQVFAKIQGKPLEIRWLGAAAVYAIMIGALWFFAVEPSKTWYEAAGRGAALGFVMYGLYDLTNYATLTNYPIHFALTDMAWGTYLFAVTAAAAKLY